MEPTVRPVGRPDGTVVYDVELRVHDYWKRVELDVVAELSDNRLSRAELSLVAAELHQRVSWCHRPFDTVAHDLWGQGKHADLEVALRRGQLT